MNRLSFVLIAPLLLSACSHDPQGVRISREAPSPDVHVASHTEPVFYNGRTYQVSISPSGDGGMNLGIAGMSAAQGKDASALALSAMHHSSCKDSQKVVMAGPATFDGANWRASGRCSG